MERATTVPEMINAFKETPLEAADMENFYQETMFVRTGQEGESPIKDIHDGCREPQERNAYLLMGHRGCGKSTELNRLAKDLEEEGFPVRTIHCNAELDRANMDYTDVLILMGDALLSLAEETGRLPDHDDMKLIRDFWTISTERQDTVTDDAAAEVQAEAGTGVGLLELLKLSLSTKASLKYDVEQRTVYREKIKRRSSQWLAAMNRVADCLTGEDGKQPVLIFEDLDKGDTWEIFDRHCETLTGVSFPVIYTFPIAYFYNPAFNDLSGFFREICRLPMIKTREIDGTPCKTGRAAIRAIVEKRADPALFEENVLDSLIERTGGCLRHLFQAISTAAILARRLRKTQIPMELADRALTKIKSDLSRRVEGREHDFLVEVATGNHRKIDDRPMLLRMMQALTVLEYNGECWYNVHPLMEEYLREIDMLPKDSHEG